MTDNWSREYTSQIITKPSEMSVTPAACVSVYER